MLFSDHCHWTTHYCPIRSTLGYEDLSSGSIARIFLCQWGLRHSAEVDKFVKVASASLPRVSEIIAAASDEDRAGAFELAERRYAQAARDFGCDEAESKRWVKALMRKLRALVVEAD